MPQADTLHAIALAEWEGEPPAVLTEDAAKTLFAHTSGLSGKEMKLAWDTLALSRERLTPAPELDAIAKSYASAKRERHLADYTDLLEQWLSRLLSVNTAGNEPRWSQVLVDEIQDLSPLQLALIRALSPHDGKGFFGIGDPDQAIYSFRGAHPDVLGALRDAWPTLQTITLAASHRSAADILTSASALLGPAAACGRLTATRNTAASLHLFEAPDSRREAAWVADNIACLMGGTSHTLEDARRRESPLSTPCSPGEIAVLVRVKALIPPLKTALERRGIPCAVPEAAPFWSDPTVALLLEIAGHRFSKPVATRPTERPLSEFPFMQDSKMYDTAPNRLTPENLVTLLEAHGLTTSLFRDSAPFHALLRAFREHGGWEGLLDWVSLRQDLDLVRQQAEQVQIMTLHAAKGLEFRAVFLPALEEGLLPFFGMEPLLGAATEPETATVAEERRLLYVGLTRAQDAVFASLAAQRHLYGKVLSLKPSRFLNDLPDLFRRTRIIRHTQTTATQISLF